MARQDNKKHYICRDIKVRYILTLLFTKGLFGGNKIVLYYLNPNGISSFLEKLGNLLTNEQNRKFSLLHYKHDIAMMKNDKGISLIKASGCDDLNEIINKIDKMEFSEGGSVFDCLDKKLSYVKKDLQLYVKQQVALHIFDDLLMANMAHWLSTNSGSELYGRNPVLLFEKKNYWSRFIIDHLKGNKVDYIVFSCLNLKHNGVVRFTYYLTKLIFELATAIFKRRRVLSLGKSKIGVPFYVFQNFTDFMTLRNYYLFWFYKSGINPEDIFIYVPDSEFRISEQEVINIENAGFNLHFCPTHMKRKTVRGVPVHICSFRSVSILLRYLKEIIRLRRRVKSRFMKEQWKLLSLLFIQLPYWEDFFQNNNIKIKFRFHDIFGVRDIAAKISEVITLSYHYSNHSDARITREEISDVFFLWGEKYERCLFSNHSTAGTLIKTGYVFDYVFDGLREKAGTVRATLRNSNATYIIGILDENITRHINYFTQSVLMCYRAVFEYAVNHADIGIVVKPKKEVTIEYLRTSEKTAELMWELEQQNRIVVLDSNRFPVEAGYASDMVIGVIPDSTAGLECVLAGVPMVVYDCTNRRGSHPIYEKGYNRIIFDDIKYLMDMIDINKRMPGSTHGFADWSFVLAEVDPFRDGKANQRIGSYMRTLLTKLNDGLTSDESIKAANDSYANEFGPDKVKSVYTGLSLDKDYGKKYN